MKHHPSPRQHTNTSAHLRNMARRQGPAQARRRARRALRGHLFIFGSLEAVKFDGQGRANTNGAPVEVWQMGGVGYAYTEQPDDMLPVNPRVAGWSHVCFIEPESL